MKKVICPDCNGDGKETCHNPDHGLVESLVFHDIGRRGCPGCGHDENYKTGSGLPCETCDGDGTVTQDVHKEWIENR